MKNKLMSLALGLMPCVAFGQNIALPQPNVERSSKSVVEALASRHSVREFAATKLTEQELSDLCWAACGVSRDNDHRTAPTAMNRKEIRLYVFTEEGAYEYLPVENVLEQKAAGDHRALVAGSQEFAKTAPVSLVMVMDFERFGSENEHAKLMTCVDAGIVSENVNLYCESVGLVTVPRATMDVAGISRLLGLTEKQQPIMNNPVGKPVAVKKGIARVYDETIDPMKQIDAALVKAKAEGKNVICQVGGNWCKWCLRFADFITKDADLAKMVDENFVYIHVDFNEKSPAALQERLGQPGRFGYPALVVLRPDGSVLHIQDSSYLEAGDGYSKKKVTRFLKNWK